MLIGEVSRRSGLSKDGLRHYEALGLIHSAPIQAGSGVYRDYDDTTLGRHSLIALAKRLGFGLKEMVEPLDRMLSDAITEEERRALLQEKAEEVNVRIAELVQACDMLLSIAASPHKQDVDPQLKELGLWID